MPIPIRSLPARMAVRRSGWPGWERERLADDLLLHHPAADALRADAGVNGSRAVLNMNLLQVWLKPAFGDAGGLAAVASQVLGLTSLPDRVSARWAFTADVALGCHVT
jgi:hypothetical protein